MVKAQRAKMLRAKTEKLSASATPKITAINNAKKRRAAERENRWGTNVGRRKRRRDGGGGGTVWDCPDRYDPFKPNSYEDAKLQHERQRGRKSNGRKTGWKGKKIKEEEREKEKKEKERRRRKEKEKACRWR